MTATAAEFSAVSAGVARARLDNGLRIVAVRRTWSPAVAVNLWYDVGSRDDPPGRSGFAHLFEHMMFQGSTRVPAGAHFSLVQAAGGVLNASTGFDRTNYFETLPVEALDLALWLEADRLQGLDLSATNFENQRGVVKNERRLRYDDMPYGTAAEQLFAAAFPPGHPYHHTTIGITDHLDAASLEDARAFFADHYRTSRAVLTIAGDVDPDRALEQAAAHFADLADAAHPAAPHTEPAALRPPLQRQPPHPVSFTREETVPAPAIHLLFRLPADGDPDCDAAVAAMRILASGPRGRLHDRLVRDLRLAAFAAGSVSRLRVDSSVGLVVVRGLPGTDPDVLWDETRAVFESFAIHGPKEAELTGAAAVLSRAARDRLDDLPALADELSRHELVGGDASAAFDVPGSWLTLDPAAVARTARLLHPAEAFRLTTLPRSA